MYDSTIEMQATASLRPHVVFAAACLLESPFSDLSTSPGPSTPPPPHQPGELFVHQTFFTALAATTFVAYSVIVLGFIVC